jgi:hypothetical protein
LSKNIIKFVVICSLPAVITFGFGYIVWPSSYITIPVFFPFSPYSTNTTTWAQTIFHTSKHGWYFFMGYSTLIAAVITWITREKLAGKPGSILWDLGGGFYRRPHNSSNTGLPVLHGCSLGICRCQRRQSIPSNR